MATNGTITPTTLESLATSILELSKTYDPNQKRPLGQDHEIVIKARELIAEVQSPTDHASSVITSLVEASSIKTLLSLKALQAIPESGSISVQDLETATGAEAALLERLLRVLVGTSFINRNPSDQSYSHTALSLAYATGIAGMFFSNAAEELAVMASLPAYLKAKGARDPDGELAMTHNPNTWFHNQEGKTAFEIIEQDPERLKNFQQLMGLAEHIRPYTGFYDFGKLSVNSGTEADRPVLVDVGGGDGRTIAKILAAHLEIKSSQCYVQDMAKTVALAHQNPDLPKGVQIQAHDFFTPQPVLHAKAYLLRAVCHDWSDTMVIRILKHLVTAMAPDSKVLIGDNVLPEGGVKGLAAYMDMMMFCIGGKERTRKDFEFVLGEAGLKLDGIYFVHGEDGFAIVEASLKG